MKPGFTNGRRRLAPELAVLTTQSLFRCVISRWSTRHALKSWCFAVFVIDFQSVASGPSGKNDDATIRAAIERVVDGTRPAPASGAPLSAQLRGAVECAIDHAVTLIDPAAAGHRCQPPQFYR